MATDAFDIGPDRINQAAWSETSTLRWFSTFEGWSDPGERAAVSSVVDELRGAPILDVGVGAGRTTPILRALSDNYRAIDFSPAMVEICARKYPNVHVDFGDARNLSRFADGSFGLVMFSWNGIDAVSHDDRELVLREAFRVLRPGGVFIFSSHNKLGPGHGETPWSIRRDDVAHPRRLVHKIRGFRRSLSNHRHLRKLNRDEGAWSMMNASAHDFAIVIHYTTLALQLDALRHVGFDERVDVFDSRRGAPVLESSDTRRMWWFHFVARRPMT